MTLRLVRGNEFFINEEERICNICKKKDSKEGWCPDCKRCWDCIGDKCKEPFPLTGEKNE